MIPDVKKYLPLVFLLATAGGLWWFSPPMVSDSQYPHDAGIKLNMPRTPMLYSLPVKLRDPFQTGDVSPTFREQKAGESSKSIAVGKSKASAAGVTLDGIIWDPVHPMASINGDVLSEGGHIGKIEVLRILPDQVILRIGGQKMVKHLLEIK